MKRLLVLFFALATMAGVARSEPPFDGFGRREGFRGNFGIFYSSLSRRGEWIDFNSGYAWRPFGVSHGWRPYLYGRWVWSDYGWYWVSDESFGWATYHYGRWYYDDYYGWIWVPGETWGPAWVEWRYDDDYIGWAPLSPYAEFDVSFGITYRDNWSTPYNYWNFVPGRYFCGTRVVDYVQPVDRTRRIFGNTRSVVGISVDNDRVINRGIDVNFVERRGNVRVDKVDVIARDRGNGERFMKDGDRQRVEVFRPRLDAQVRGNDVRPPNARRAEHPISFDGPVDRRSDRSDNPAVRPPDSRRDTRIQERTPVERAPEQGRRAEPQTPQEPRRDTRVERRVQVERPQAPERRIETPRPSDRSNGRERQMRETPRPERRQQETRQAPQERRMPAVRPAPGQRGNPQGREAPREKPKERRDEPPRGRRG
ncbi:MAG TPA: DUF6600 domain-containing protein [Bacteroidota bacterium]|jgi:hypothetical protein